MKKGTISLTTGLLMISAALCLTIYNMSTDIKAGREVEEILELVSGQITNDPVPEEGRILRDESAVSAVSAVSEDDIEYPDYVLNPNMDMPSQKIDGNAYIGTLSLPTLNLELPVMETWDYNNLKLAPCRYEGSVYLNNMIICAHNYVSFFGTLRNLSYGDLVFFTDMDGNVFSYVVQEIEVIDPYAIERMASGNWDLTLFTCTPGGATRVTVRCGRIDGTNIIH